MEINIHKLLVAIAILFMQYSCSFEDEPLPLYGTPTRMALGESPIDTVCRIQAEFRELPKPLMQAISYEPPWTSRNFGAAPVDHRGYHKVELTPAGLEFLQKHSRLELVISLTPLFAEKDIGGEAAVLLAGIPAGNKSTQSGKTAKIANAVKETYYKSPKNPGDWYKKAEYFYSRVNTLSGLGNQTESIHQRRPENLSASLESKIIDVLYAYGRAPYKPFEQWPYMPQPHNIDLVKKWIENNNAPKLTEKAQQFISNDTSEFVALVLFPFLPEPGQSVLSRDDILVMYLLDLESDYWPSIMQLSSSKKYINQLRKEYHQAVFEKITTVCNR